MKKYFGIIAAAFAALSVLSCQQEVEPEGCDDANLVPLKIVTSVDAKSSLELDGESEPTGRVLWDYGDEITVFDGVGARRFTSDITEEGAHSHVAAFDGNVDAGATAFAAVYPYAEGYTADDYDGSVISTAIPSQQLVSAPGSYSRNANVCVAYASKDDEEHVAADEDYVITQMLFHNVGGLLKFTLEQGGVHKSVTIRTTDNSALTGAIEATAATGAAVSAAEGSVDYVTIAAENGGFLAAGDYYAVVLPFAEKTVSLEFSNGSKSKKRKSSAVISLGRAAMRDLGTIDAGIDYIPGDYLIGHYSSAKKWILMDPAFASTIYPSVNTEVDTPFATLSYTEFFTELDTNDYLWRVRKDENGYYIYHFDGTTNKYLAYSGSSNNAQQVTELSSPSTYFDITVEDGVAEVESKATSGRKLRYNSGNPRFVFYASGQQDIWFIPAAYDSREILSLEFAETAKSLTTKNYSSFTGQAATATSGSAPVSVSLSYSWDGDAIIESFNTATGVLALNGATGTATVSASYTGEDYRPAEASYTITVSAAAAAKWVKTDLADIAAGDTLVIVDLNTVKAMTNANGTGSAPAATAITLAAANTELNAAPAAEVRWVLEKPSASTYKFKKPGTTDYLYCTATNNGVRVGTNSNNVFSIALDGSNNPFLLNSGTNRYVGVYSSQDWRCYTSINANINATRTAFFAKQDNTTWVLDTINVTTPPTKTVYEVGDSFDDSGMVVSATYVDEDDNTHTKVVVVDASELTIVAPDMSTTGEKTVSISWEGKSTTQPITVIAMYTLTISNAVNGTVSATVDEAAVPSGSKVAVGKTVSITTTPSSGYQLASLSYSDGSDHDIISSKSFTMPANNVTVTATFSAVPTIGINKSSIANVAAAGVTNASESGVYSLLNGATDASVTVSFDGTVVTAASKNNGAITYSVAANTGAARDGWIKIKYASEDPHEITVSQLAGTSGASIGDVLWSETWTGTVTTTTASTSTVPSANCGPGTTVYNDEEVTYTQNSGTTTYLRYDTELGKGSSDVNLLLAKNSGTWTISGIPTGAATGATLTFYVNNKSNGATKFAVSSSTQGVTLGSQTIGSESAKPFSVTYSITFSEVETFNLTFSNTNSSNVRIDDISVVVTSVP